jgi:hypothetical protein
MATDMEFMNRIFHAALRRDLERMINALAGANDHGGRSNGRRLPSMLAWSSTCSTITTPGRIRVSGRWCDAAPPISGANWTQWRPSTPPSPARSFRPERLRVSMRRRSIQQPAVAGCNRRSQISVVCSCLTWTTKKPR